jgi:hypothetical protein
MEGIVRQILEHLPAAEIAFVYTVSHHTVKFHSFRNGTLPRTILAWEEIANHYGIPTIHLGLYVLQQSEAGNVRWFSPLPTTKEEEILSGSKFIFSKDGTHPHASTGCKKYTEAIERSLPLIWAQSQDEMIQRNNIPLPLDPLNYENATFIPSDQAKLGGSVETVSPAVKGASKGLPRHRGCGPGDTFTLAFKGSFVGLYSIVGPASGDIQVAVDGEAFKKVQLFSSYNFYERIGFFTLYNTSVNRHHTLIVDGSTEVPNKVAILAKKNKTIEPQYVNKTEYTIVAFCVI